MKFAGHDASIVSSGEECLEAADRTPPDVILLDLRLPGIDGLDVLRELRRRGNTASVVMMTAHGNIDTAVDAMKAGASDFCTKPLDLGELQLVVHKVLEHRRVAMQLDYFRDRERSESALEKIIGDSEPMQVVKRFINRLFATPALASDHAPSILITGETGTGKDLVARAIHFGGSRRDEPFVHVNCTAIPEQLVESELFGHVKGAFTDARGDKRGLFESADGGTLFLDEIGHMKLAVQAKLLSVLEHRTVRPVGGTRERKVNVHVVAATNCELEEAVEKKEFREDLFHRLTVLTIPMPPLRDRGNDVEALANHFLALYTARFNLPIKGFSPAAMEQLKKYNWPGNVRELSHMIESAVITCIGPYIEVENLRISRTTQSSDLALELPGEKTIRLDFNGTCPTLDEIENRVIRSVLNHTNNNLSHAARILGISRDAIRYRMEKFNEKNA